MKFYSARIKPPQLNQRNITEKQSKTRKSYQITMTKQRLGHVENTQNASSQTYRKPLVFNHWDETQKTKVSNVYANLILKI